MYNKNIIDLFLNSIYSLIGAAAMLTGFSRLTLSIVVIVVELTENTQYLLPIILVQKTHPFL